MSEEILAIDPQELRQLVRRMVREELAELFPKARPEILDDLSHEGPEDPDEDDQLLREALATLQEHQIQPDGWMSWEDFEAELDRAEAAGELST